MLGNFDEAFDLFSLSCQAQRLEALCMSRWHEAHTTWNQKKPEQSCSHKFLFQKPLAMSGAIDIIDEVPKFPVSKCIESAGGDLRLNSPDALKAAFFGWSNLEDSGKAAFCRTEFPSRQYKMVTIGSSSNGTINPLVSLNASPISPYVTWVLASPSCSPKLSHSRRDDWPLNQYKTILDLTLHRVLLNEGAFLCVPYRWLRWGKMVPVDVDRLRPAQIGDVWGLWHGTSLWADAATLGGVVRRCNETTRGSRWSTPKPSGIKWWWWQIAFIYNSIEYHWII